MGWNNVLSGHYQIYYTKWVLVEGWEFWKFVEVELVFCTTIFNLVKSRGSYHNFQKYPKTYIYKYSTNIPRWIDPDFGKKTGAAVYIPKYRVAIKNDSL